MWPEDKSQGVEISHQQREPGTMRNGTQEGGEQINSAILPSAGDYGSPARGQFGCFPADVKCCPVSHSTVSHTLVCLSLPCSSPPSSRLAPLR